jgi:hypothetical protein
LGLNSSQRVWRFHVFEVVFSIWRFGDVFDFFIVVVIRVVFAPLVIIIVVLLIFIREVKLDPKLTFPLALNNKLFGRLAESQHIPAFIKLLDSANGLLVSEDFIDIVDVVSIIKRDIKPNFLLGAVFEFEKVLLFIWR